jgi:hypothetical protein
MNRSWTQRLPSNIGHLSAAAFFAASPVMAGQDCECLGNGKRIKEGGVICLQIGSSTTLSGALRAQSQQHQLEEDRRRLPGFGSFTGADVSVAGWIGCPEKRLIGQPPAIDTVIIVNLWSTE